VLSSFSARFPASSWTSSSVSLSSPHLLFPLPLLELRPSTPHAARHKQLIGEENFALLAHKTNGQRRTRRREASHFRTTAVDIDTAYAINQQSISRLHDDELSCVLPFLSLPDLAQLVRCSRRFNALARKERSRGLQLKGGSTIVPPSSSTLKHHVASLHLERSSDSDAPLTLDVLRRLRGLP